MALSKQELESVRILINEQMECERISTLTTLMALFFLFLILTVVLGNWNIIFFFLYTSLLGFSFHLACRYQQRSDEIKVEIMKKMINEEE